MKLLWKHIKFICDKYACFKKIVVIIFISITLLLVGCSKQNFEFKELSFESESGNSIIYYGIESYTGNENEVVIPNTYKNCEVRYIFSKSFALQNIKSVDVGKVKQIWDYAFKNCLWLENVDLRYVEHIGAYAFYSCKRLKTIVIPASIVTIETGAFSCCDMLESVYFMGNPQDLQSGIFGDNKNITIYGMAGGNVEQYATNEGLPFSTLS